MTFSEIQALLHHATKNDIILGIYPTLINQAIQHVQRRRSWRSMKRTMSTLVGAGYSFGSLPLEFKEPQRGTHPLSVSDTLATNTARIPWELISKQEAGWLNRRGMGCRAAYVDTLDGQIWAVHSTEVAASNMYFHLDSYVFSVDLTLPTETHYLINNYPQMILEKAKSLAFALEDAEKHVRQVEIAEIRFEKEFLIAAADDSSREVSGRKFRMGGW